MLERSTVRAWIRATRAPARRRRYGDVTLQTLWPPSPARGSWRGCRPGDGPTANDASVVLLAEAGGLRILLTGDVEPHAQAVLARMLTGLEVDVLKVPHHGSPHQDEDWLLSLDPAVALVSVGADNDYGHPARAALDPLAAAGAEVAAPTSGATWRSWCATATGGRRAGLPERPGCPCRVTGSGAVDVLGRVTLVTGKEEFLNERTVQAVRAAVRAHDPEAELSETRAGDLTLATLGELAAPSLFSSIRCVVVRDLEDLPEASVDGLLDYAAAPAEDVALVLVHGGGVRGSRDADQAAQGGRGDGGQVGRAQGLGVRGLRDGRGPLARRPDRQGGRRGPGEAVGQDLRSLAAAADQLSHDADGAARHRGGGEALLRRPGRGEVVRDRRRRLPRTQPGGARGAALGAGDRRAVDLRHLRVRRFGARPGPLPSAAKNVREADLAREVGVPPWKLKDIKAQAHGWTDHGLARAIRAVAQADADIKGAASDASYTLERLVLTITGLRAAQVPEMDRPAGGYGRVDAGAMQGSLRERRPSSRSPTCGWRPGSCG